MEKDLSKKKHEQPTDDPEKVQYKMVNSILLAVARLIESLETDNKENVGPNKAFGNGKIWG